MVLNMDEVHLLHLYVLLEIVAVCLKQSLSDCLLTLSNLLIEEKRQLSDVLVSIIGYILSTTYFY